MTAFTSGIRKYLIVVVLALIGALPFVSANAQVWERWGGDDVVTSYILKDSYEVNGVLAAVWFMIDHKLPKRLDNGIQYRSEKIEQLFFCDDHTTTVKSFIAFSEAMGKGKQVYSSSVQSTDYKKYAPDDWKNAGFDRFCKKRWQFWK